ncbi:MAG: outer membrane protein assembly factor BamA [Phycisphaerales bacterium]
MDASDRRPPGRKRLHGPAARPGGWRAALASAAAALALAAAALAMDVEDEALADRPVTAVKVAIRGRNMSTEQEVRNNLRIAVGQPFDAKVVKQDVSTLYRLGRFGQVSADATILPDGSVEVTYTVEEQAIVESIDFSGNYLVTDQDLRKAVPLQTGAPRDDFLLEQSIIRIKELYRGRGNYLVEVKVDESKLDQGLILFQVIEGPRVRIREIEFVGNDAFPGEQLEAQIKTKPWVFLFRKGELDEDMLVEDVATLDRYYKDNGYMDVRVDRRIELSNDQREVKIVFTVQEGRQYRLRDIIVRAGDGGSPREMTREQLGNLAVIQRGDPFQKNLIEKTRKAIEQAYQVMGYIDVRLADNYVRVGEAAEVDLLLSVREGVPYVAGLVHIEGHVVTQDKVIRRLVRFQPGRPMDGRELKNTEQRLEATQIFREPRITPQAPTAEEPGVRDVLVEIKEKQTGSVNFGVGAGTDSGFFGEVSVKAQNFDVADVPRSWDEFLGGRSFRGAGQTFNLAIAPGIDVSNYNISIGDPHLLDSDWGGNVGLNYRNRVFQGFNENRVSGLFGLSTRIGDFWTFSLNPRVESVELTDLGPNTPVEIWEQRGPSYNSMVLAQLSRTEVDNIQRPGRGTQIELQAGYHGVFGGDYDYPQVGINYTQFFTTYEDFLGRKQVLRIRGEASYIFSQDAPVFERWYMGGRTMRGFAFRTVSPKSDIVIGDNPPATIGPSGTYTPIGGNFLFFAGAQYEIPVIGNFISVVTFVDSGTVNNDSWLNEYRVGVGAGLRIYIPQFGQAPIALDFAYPVVKQELDEEQVFSFTIDLPL